jgi:bleomycin hydrolase
MFRFITCLILTAVFSLSGNTADDKLEKYALETLAKKHKPHSIDIFKAAAHLPAVNQDTTNACWSFANLSFVESEMQRLGMKPVKLAMMYPVYFSFIEKARYFIKTRGESRFAPGGLFTDVFETIEKYGIVPLSAYEGMTENCSTFNHTELEDELKNLMAKTAAAENWDEKRVLSKVRKMLDAHLGTPPKEFMFDGRKFTPKKFLFEIVKLPWKDYIIVTSFMYAPFYKFTSLDVPDNWGKREIYFNVPLDVFYASLKSAVQNGYSAAFDSDTGEPGRMGEQDAVFVPEFDIPSNMINQQAREFRFDNKSTTDDHLMHFIGFKEIEGDDWFLVKDSWRTAWDGQFPGYYFFHGDYIKLKVLAYVVHKDAVPGLTKYMQGK